MPIIVLKLHFSWRKIDFNDNHTHLRLRFSKKEKQFLLRLLLAPFFLFSKSRPSLWRASSWQISDWEMCLSISADMGAILGTVYQINKQMLHFCLYRICLPGVRLGKSVLYCHKPVSSFVLLVFSIMVTELGSQLIAGSILGLGS